MERGELDAGTEKERDAGKGERGDASLGRDQGRKGKGKEKERKERKKEKKEGKERKEGKGVGGW